MELVDAVGAVERQAVAGIVSVGVEPAGEALEDGGELIASRASRMTMVMVTVLQEMAPAAGDEAGQG